MKLKPLLLLAALLLSPFTVLADTPSPEGFWKTIDDATGKPRSIVKIALVNGELEAVVQSGFPLPGEQPNPTCDLCPGEFKGKPKIGLRIVWGLREDGGEFSGGHVLDPDKGEIYKCKIKVMPDGKTLELRGYIGIPLIGRTQTWRRVEDAKEGWNDAQKH